MVVRVEGFENPEGQNILQLAMVQGLGGGVELTGCFDSY
jgi:hypothetical protein